MDFHVSGCLRGAPGVILGAQNVSWGFSGVPERVLEFYFGPGGLQRRLEAPHSPPQAAPGEARTGAPRGRPRARGV